MSTDPAAGARPEETSPEGQHGDPQGEERQPSWWHRDHPTFAALSGFFTGLVYVVVVPGLFAAVLELVVKDSTAQDLYPFVLVMLALPLVLLVPHRTRRFGLYMLLGIVVTAVVVGGVASLVLWYMVDVHG
jgi:hypothetical protein